MDIAFVIPSLGPGGAERVASLLCNFWTKQGHTVTLITFEKSEAEPFYLLHHAIAVRQIGAPSSASRLAGKLLTNARRVSRLRSILRTCDPDIVVAFTTDASVVALCAARALAIPVVISERNQLDRPGFRRVHRLARRLCYPWAAALAVQTKEIAADARCRFNVPVHVLPNPVLLNRRRPHRNLDENQRRTDSSHLLVAVGRLVHQKGFDLLIESFSALAESHPSWQLIIYGEGPDRVPLEAAIHRLSLADRIFLPGVRKDIGAALADANLFVLPSRFEGYPNALLEALACGCPVVASACPGGITEIMGNGNYGLLVAPESVIDLTAALDLMMSDCNLRRAYSRRARHAVRYLNLETVGKRWLDLLSDVSGDRCGA